MLTRAFCFLTQSVFLLQILTLFFGLAGARFLAISHMSAELSRRAQVSATGFATESD
jgi:hypothetical protein